MSEQLHIRSFAVREFNEKTRTFKGIAVPWDTPVEIRDWFGSYTEQFKRGSVSAPDTGKVLVCYRHGEEIGLLTKHEDRDEGWYVEGRISETSRGNDAYVLLRDGVTEELSIGFLPVRHEMDDDTGDITRTEVIAREVSLVPFGAYGADAKVSEVRAANQTAPAPERSTLMETETLAQEVTELRSSMEELSRSFTAFATRAEAPAVTRDRRSAAQFLSDLARGDEATRNAYNALMEHLHDPEYHAREYTGGTSADAPIKDQWVGDLTRLFDSSSGLLSDLFGVGTLPATGLTIEYGELASNSTQVTEQTDEGDDLAFGKVTLTTKTAPVKTYGGYTQLSRQAIERSTMPLLQRNLEALSQAAGARKKAVLRAAFTALVNAREGIADNAGVIVLGATLAASTSAQWEGLIRKAAIRYSRENTAPQSLVVSESVFEKLQGLTIDKDRVLRLAEGNSAGTLNLLTIRGTLAGLPVYLDPDRSGDSAVFIHGDALRQYDSAVVQLQDENIINLSKDFSVYRYGAVAAEIPQLVVPVKLAAS